MLRDDDRDEVHNKVKGLMSKAETRTSSEEDAIPVKELRFFCFEGNMDDEQSDEFELYMRTARFSMYSEDKMHLVKKFW